jgi:hypothetical protein
VDGSRYVSQTVEEDAIFKGGCRCGDVKYTSSAVPTDIVICHCCACQQVSGSAYLAFIQVPSDALDITDGSSRKKLKLSAVAERTFCSSCGTPITMAYSFSAEHVSITMGSVDLQSFKCELPKVAKHMFVSEKAPWVLLPDDGAERWGTMENAHLIVPDKAS